MFWTPNWKKRARARQWGLAAGGILTKLNEENFDQLAFRCGKARSRHCLREWWNVDHFLDFFLKRTLEWLWTEGHSSSCIELCEAYFPSVESNEMPPYEISTELYQFMKSHLDQLRTSRLVAWDMCRLVNVARWGYTANFIRATEAWTWILRTAAGCRNHLVRGKPLGRIFYLVTNFGGIRSPQRMTWTCCRPTNG